MSGQQLYCMINIAIAQGIQDGMMFPIGWHAPFRAPACKQKPGTRQIQIIDSL